MPAASLELCNHAARFLPVLVEHDAAMAQREFCGTPRDSELPRSASALEFAQQEITAIGEDRRFSRKDNSAFGGQCAGSFAKAALPDGILSRLKYCFRLSDRLLNELGLQRIAGITGAATKGNTLAAVSA